ncbi:MAG: glycosyltransferase [Anaerolinea sp.]|nr:glycosyltransferase [Anaerolinea sp.]
MRLLLISRCPPHPVHLGDRLIIHHLSREFAQRGHTLDLLAFYDRPTDPDEVTVYRDRFREVLLIPAAQRGGLSYLRRLLLPGALFPTQAQAAWSAQMWRSIEARLPQVDRVMCFGGIQVYEYQTLVKRKPNLIVPYESYSLFLKRALGQEVSLQGRIRVGLMMTLARAYERRMFRGFDRVSVLTDVDAAALRNLEPSLPLTVIPNGIDLRDFPPTRFEIPKTTPQLIFVGNYEYAPNADAALFLAHEIFPLVQAQIPHVQLLLVGNAPPDSLQALNRPGLIVTGRVPEVYPLLADASVFVCPLRYGAGIKNKVLEGMAAGLPLVVTPLSADGIGLIEGVHAHFGTDAPQLAKGVIALLRSPEQARRMGQDNRALIEAKFTWGAVADQYLQALGAED